MKKLPVVVLIVALLLSLMAGCGGKEPDTNTPTAAPQTAVPAPATPAPTQEPQPTQESEPTDPAVENETRIITDVLGREVEIPAVVNTCAALSSATRTITYAGGLSKVIGTSEMEMRADPGMPFAYANKEYLAGCTAISSGGSGNTYYDEAIIELNPDVMIINTNNVETCDDFQQKFGIPVIAIYADKFTSPNLTNSIRLVGEVLGTQEHAEMVASQIETWNAELNELTKDIPDSEKPSVYLGAVSFSGGHGFCGTYCNYAPLIAINALNVADALGEKSGVEIAMEQVIEWDPDIIFLNPGNMNLVNEEYASDPTAIDSLRAVQEGRVYSQVNFNYYSTNMELAIVDAYYAGSVIFPEAFRGIDFAAKAEEVFNVMIGTDYLGVLEENGLSFGPVRIGE